MQRIKQNTSYYINERAVNLVENALGDPSLIQVSLYSGTVVLVYIKGIIDYAYDGGYQRFPLYGYNTALISNEAHHIYIRIERSRGTAMLLFSTQEYEFDSDESGQYWYIRCGEVTSAGSGSTPREITFDSGLLSTAEGLEGMLDGRYVSVSYFERIFDVLNGSTSVRTNDLNTVFDSLKVKTGLWTEQYVSALGRNSGGGGGGGGLDRQTLFDSILKSTPATGEYINPAFLPIDGTSIYIQNGVLKSRGTISSVGLYVPNGSGLVVTGSPLTSNGTINLAVANGYVIPTTSRMSAIESSIADLDARVDALEDMFGIDSDGDIYVKHGRGFYSYSFVSALGSNSGGGGGGGLDRETLFNILKGNPATGEYINSRFLKLGTGLTIDGNGNIKVDGVSVTWSSIQGTPPFYTKQESDSLFVKVSFFNKLFAAFNGTTAVATNDVNATIDNIKSLVGFWTNEYISALGRNSNASPTGINEQELWNILGTASAHTIDVSHIPSLSAYALANHTHTFADLTTHPNTLSGYGITNAYTKTEVDDKLNLYLSKAFFNKLFKAHNGNNDVLPSNPTADASANITDIEAMFGFWTKEYISALGRNASTPTLALAGLSDVNVQGAQNGQALVYNAATGKWIPGVVSGGSSAWADITGKPTTLSGYGITDAYINSSGTIVLGSSSITPVKTTGNQDVSGQKRFLDNLYIGPNTSSNFKRIYFGDSDRVYIGESSDDYLNIYSYEGMNFTNTRGNVSINGNTILHAGNYSSYITDTDTKNTAGSTNKTGSKMFIIGATSQDTNPQTYSNSNCYIGTDNCLYSGGTKVLTSHQSLAGYATQTWVNNKGYAYSSDLDDYVLKAGDTMTGNLVVQKSNAKISVHNGSTEIGLNNDNNRGVWDYSTSRWLITTNGTNSWLNCGDVGIGTNSPSYKLHVAGNGCFTNYLTLRSDLYIYNAKSIYFKDSDGTDRSVLNFSANNNINIGYGTYSLGSGLYIYGKTLVVRIGGTSATYNALSIDASKNASFTGNITASGDVTALSDIRQKSPISNVNTRIEDVANLPLFYFRWKYKDDENLHIGTSAQAVQKLFPELVLGGEELSVNYGVLGTTLGILNSRKLTEHEKRILDLEKENKALRREINKLKGVVK